MSQGSNQGRRQRTTIEDVARVAGVSTMSVSRAMRGIEGVSPETRERILQTADALQYQPSRVAGSLATANSALIGISLPTLFDVVFAEILDGMRGTFAHAGFDTVIDTTEYASERENTWLRRVLAWRPAGVILSGVDHPAETRWLLQRARVPTLELWDLTDRPIDLCVGVDHNRAGLMLGRHLVALGYRNPAFVGVTSGHDIRAEKRFAGLREAFADVGQSWMCDIRIGHRASFEGGYEGATAVLDAGGCDVICFLNDHMAFGGMMACQDRGLSAPESIGIAGFNGFNINAVLPRPITTIVTRRAEMGRAAALLLMGRIRGADVPDIQEIPVDLFPGETTRMQVPAGTR